MAKTNAARRRAFEKRQEQERASRGCWGGYMVHAERTLHGKQIPYTTDEIDFLVVYVVPENAWFVIPVRAFVPLRSLHVYPLGYPDGGRYEKYREAWWLLE
jgi:hypothetical protein